MEKRQDRRDKDPLGIRSHRVSAMVLADFPLFIEHVLNVKIAAALVHRDTKEMTRTNAQRIVGAARALQKAEPFNWALADPFSGGGGIVLHSLVNSVLADRSGVDVALINRGQSTADVLSTAHRMTLYELCDLLMAEILVTHRTFQFLSRKFAKTPTMARTCLRDAMPSRLGRLFEGPVEFYDRIKDRLIRSQSALLKAHLGGTVIGSGEGASLAYRKSILGQLADVSGLKLRRRRNTYDGAQNIDELADVAKTLEILAEGTLKIAKDFRLLMSGPRHGLNEIEWPMLIKGSTFFKGKNNPTIPETVMQGCFLILGQATVVQQCHLHGELNLNVFEGAAGFALQEAVQTAVRTLRAWNDHGLADVYALQRGAQ